MKKNLYSNWIETLVKRIMPAGSRSRGVRLAAGFATFISVTVLADIQLPDFTTPHTNTQSSSGYITIPGVCTNAAYFAYNFTNVGYGESLFTAQQKASNNWVWQSNQIAAAIFTTTNYIATNQLPAFSTNILTATVGGHWLYITNSQVRAVQ